MDSQIATVLLDAARAQGIALRPCKGKNKDPKTIVCMKSPKKPPGLTDDLFLHLNCCIKL